MEKTSESDDLVDTECDRKDYCRDTACRWLIYLCFVCEKTESQRVCNQFVV